jgi:hypothetical protein
MLHACISFLNCIQLEFPNKIIKIHTKYIASLFLMSGEVAISDQKKVDIYMTINYESKIYRPCFLPLVFSSQGKKVVSKKLHFLPILLPFFSDTAKPY